MADGNGAAKANQKNRNAETARRLSYLRVTKFETEGFKTSDPVPSFSEARSMYYRNLRKMAQLQPTPSQI